MSEFSEMPYNWAKDDADTEAEAFETALSRISPQDRIRALEQENAELRLMIQRQSAEIASLRLAIKRGDDDQWNL